MNVPNKITEGHSYVMLFETEHSSKDQNPTTVPEAVPDPAYLTPCRTQYGYGTAVVHTLCTQPKPYRVLYWY